MERYNHTVGEGLALPEKELSYFCNSAPSIPSPLDRGDVIADDRGVELEVISCSE